MTDLTEQWKKGEFVICNAGKCQYYYVQNEKQQEVIKTEYCLFDDNTPNWQILAPVPSYEEYAMTQDCVKRLFEAAEKETILKEQLRIATEALEKYADKKQWQDDMAMPIIYCEDTGYGDAQAALQKIKELANA